MNINTGGEGWTLVDEGPPKRYCNALIVEVIGQKVIARVKNGYAVYSLKGYFRGGAGYTTFEVRHKDALRRDITFRDVGSARDWVEVGCPRYDEYHDYYLDIPGRVERPPKHRVVRR